LPPYSPIEQSFAKRKTLLRKTRARTIEALWSAIDSLLKQFSTSECGRYIRHCGYCQLLSLRVALTGAFERLLWAQAQPGQ
jgi:hypothetical protein